MDKSEILGGIFRSALTGGSWLRLAIWCRSAPEREIAMHLAYEGEQANWHLRLLEHGEPIFQGDSTTLEGVTMLAVTALGKAR